MILKNIDLFTNEPKLIGILSSQFKIYKIFTENKDFYKKYKKKNKIIFYVNSRKKIFQHIQNIKSDICLGVSYGFGIIFDKTIINQYKNGIWNIHTGDLPRYRGRHPITAAFLNNEKKIGLCIHSINEKIDQGYLLAKIYVNRDYKDDEISIKNKFFRKIRNLIKSAKKNYIQKKIFRIKKGKYYLPFYKGIKIQDSKKFDYIYIHNSVKAQKSFGGIWVNGKKYYDSSFYFKKNINDEKNTVVICKNNKKLILEKKK